MTHTKGKWEVSRGAQADPYSIESETRTIAHVKHVYTVHETLDNARLIASAPDLSAACEYVVKYHRDNDSGEGELYGLDFVTTCINALRKAKGE